MMTLQQSPQPTISPSEAAAELLRRRAARTNLHKFIQYLNPDYITSEFSRTVCDALDEFIEQMVDGHRPVLILGAPPQHGKLIADYVPVMTTSGWKRHGDLTIGDKVFHPSGKSVRVIAETASAPARMRVTLTNGEVIHCHERHEWTVYDRDKKRTRTLETTEMLTLSPLAKRNAPLYSGVQGKRGCHYTYQLPLCDPINPDHVELPIHPYVLGVWLGDGTQTKPYITYDKKDCEVINELGRLGYPIERTYTHKDTGVITSKVSNLADPLKKSGLMANKYGIRLKHIPGIYLSASIEQRLDLLAGLIDTDGYTYQRNGRVVFTTSDERLADDVCALVSTFGCGFSKVTEQPKLSSSGIQGVSEYYVIGFTPTFEIPCRLDRKRNTPGKTRRRVAIKSIEHCDDGHVGKCIQVDSDDGLYLIGRTMQPTHNSDIVSRYLPAYVFGRFPDLRIGGLSYAKDLASDMNRDVQRIMMGDEYAILFPETSLNKRRFSTVDVEPKRNSETFEIVGRKGSYVSQGVGGPLTGKRLDCLVAGTKIQTDIGCKNIEDLHMHANSCKIVTYNQQEGLRYASIKAIASRKGYGIYRLTTKSGSVLELTGDHKVFTSRGWVEASKLTAGDVLVRSMPKECFENSGRLQEDAKGQWWAVLLSKMLREGVAKEEAKQVCDVRESIPSWWQKVLFKVLHAPTKVQTPTKKSKVRNVHERIYRQACRWLPSVLWPRLREQGACAQNDGEKQSPIQEWEKPAKDSAPFSESIQKSKTTGSGEGWPYVCHMRREKEATGSSSHGWMGEQQRIIKFSNPVRQASQRCPQEDGFRELRDHVDSVERILDEAITYDIEVDGDHNFFANNILVHNCGIIDDPIKNSKEALSPTVKSGIWNWYVSTFLTRLSKNSGQIIMATRWAVDDLSGMIEEKNPRAKIMAFKAIDDNGQALVPELHPVDKLLETKATMSEYFWSAMYQQSPTVLGGGLFKDEWWKYYTALPRFEHRMIYADTAQKTDEKNDYSVFQCWGKTTEGKIYLIDQIRGKWESPQLLTQAKAFWAKHSADTNGVLRQMKIEDKSSGTGLIQQFKQAGIPVQGIPRNTDKVVRALDVSPHIEAGNVHLPEDASYLSDYLTEFMQFPNGAHDDQIDPTMDAINDMLISQPKKRTIVVGRRRR